MITTQKTRTPTDLSLDIVGRMARRNVPFALQRRGLPMASRIAGEGSPRAGVRQRNDEVRARAFISRRASGAGALPITGEDRFSGLAGPQS